MAEIALMRHSDYEKGSQEITRNGKTLVEIRAKDLIEFFLRKGIAEISILHSPLHRATETARILSEHLSKNIEIKELASDNRLDLQKGLKAYIDGSLENEQDVFTIVISHQPDIRKALNKKFGAHFGVGLCDVFVRGSRLKK
jgi:phosphohistidine phosphatase SixA